MTSLAKPALSCSGLSVRYPNGSMPVRNVSFSVAAGECFALLGGSGTGKSTIARALLGLHGGGSRIGGSLQLDGVDMAQASKADWRRIRGHKIGFVAQNPWVSCDPLRPVGDHVAEAWRCHGLPVRWAEIVARLDRLGVPEAAVRIHAPPHTWSGGMLQRAAISAATALTPPILVADEPTSALDADRAQSVIQALKSAGSAILLISHDIDLVLRNADRIGVLDQGELVEVATPSDLRSRPRHPATKRLLAALAPLPPRRKATSPSPLIRLEAAGVSYKRGRIQALPATNLSIGAGEIVGLQGPSGSGKSTLLRLVMGLETPSTGTIWRDPILQRPGAILPVFQGPLASLVPHWPIWRSISEPLTARGQPRLSKQQLKARAAEAMQSVGLELVDPHARPAELSLGQCQRVAIARATITRPALIVADEPTSALDSPSIQHVSTLLRQAADHGAALLVVSHDQGLLARLADRTVTLDAKNLQATTSGHTQD
ncbi:ABC transporter ATP-binding protein [Thalassobius sp. Cn5-15]|uniref:ABC transporter ATP-binding protein n=1 Tax=Thalassobius sp. Cn5-15 TaxID=2917763 RepID=UPI001EF27B07|nr:ATP-binding cassette domain-containing protein [Thalassobius sp. Cn5-15]MCG7492008.1 ATP-binding cassette domain-containing protein [Thalassobius sp. Cn5-15]